jgi:hypothetical protein
LSDQDWINSVLVTNDDWSSGMEQMGLKVKKYMEAEELPQFNSM